jgi:peptidoglycan/xylan/chitin deacetylase (PgdA/CDA1 family)
MSVDMDEWYQCRWATGSGFSLWKDTQQCFKEYYGSDRPLGEIIQLTEKILELFSSNHITATFFFTGEIASYYPDLVKMVNKFGHEIGSHNYIHKDYDSHNRDEFFNNLKKSKEILERISGTQIIGYRAPNSTLSNYMIEDLLKAGFKYDSSVTPTRSFMGKFGRFTDAPTNPYMLANDDFSKNGNSGLLEFPWPVFPYLKLPSGSGITSRIAGYIYTKTALDYALKSGDTVYYFHPYEIGPRPKINNMNLKTKLFLRNLGNHYYNMLVKILNNYKGRFISGNDLLHSYFGKMH